MGDAVKPRRRYQSPQRASQAEATRRQIVAAAGACFSGRGYFGTTMEAIAAAAGVAVQTVYAAFGSKRAILSELIDVAVGGADPPRLPIPERSWYRAIVDEPDPARLLRRHAQALCAINARVAPVQRVVQGAAASDPDIATLWQRMKDQRLAGQHAVAALLLDRGALRPGLPLERAADVIWALADAALYDALVGDRGWSLEELSAWLGSALCAALLAGADPTRADRS